MSVEGVVRKVLKKRGRESEIKRSVACFQLCEGGQSTLASSLESICEVKNALEISIRQIFAKSTKMYFSVNWLLFEPAFTCFSNML